MVRPFFGKLVPHFRVEGKEIHVMHGNVITVYAGLQESHVEERCTVEAKVVHLIYNIDVMVFVLLVEEIVNERSKLKQLFKAISERDEQGQLVLVQRVSLGQGIGRQAVLLLATQARLWWGTGGQGDVKEEHEGERCSPEEAGRPAEAHHGCHGCPHLPHQQHPQVLGTTRAARGKGAVSFMGFGKAMADTFSYTQIILPPGCHEWRRPHTRAESQPPPHTLT